jgi:hypothetical protein
MFFFGAPVAHVVLYEEKLKAERLRRTYARCRRRLHLERFSGRSVPAHCSSREDHSITLV